MEVMLANIDKTEVLENKSAALADQAKTCGTLILHWMPLQRPVD